MAMAKQRIEPLDRMEAGRRVDIVLGILSALAITAATLLAINLTPSTGHAVDGAGVGKAEQRRSG